MFSTPFCSDTTSVPGRREDAIVRATNAVSTVLTQTSTTFASRTSASDVLARIGIVSSHDTLSRRRPCALTASTCEARPIKGHCELTFNPPPLPLPPVHRQIDTGTCWFSHLGRTALYGVQDINFAAGTQSGERTFTAANGDLLRAVHAGRSAPSGPGLVSFVTTLTFVGGTGRFANATGQMTGEGTANLITRTTSVTNEGWIAYDASDRSGR